MKSNQFNQRPPHNNEYARKLHRGVALAPSFAWWDGYFACPRGPRAHTISVAVVRHRSQRRDDNAPQCDRNRETEREPIGLIVSPARATIMKVAARHEANSKQQDGRSAKRIEEARPASQPRICPRGALGVAALGHMKPQVDRSGDENLAVESMARMSRAPGGRSRVIYVRVTEEEDCQIRRRALEHRQSAQRFLIETALSGSAALSAERRRAQRDAQRARLVLTSIANNVNQLAKWANTNRVLPDTLGAALDEVRRATAEVAATNRRLGSSFEQEPR
jgi:hypothetical protein